MKINDLNLLKDDSLADALEAINYYKQYAGQHPDGGSNTRSAWFSLDYLQKLVKRLEDDRTVMRAKVPAGTPPGDEITDGVRIYFARYKKDTELYGHNYKDRNTVYFVSTKQITQPEGNITHYDYVTNESFKLLTPPENTGELSPPSIDGAYPGIDI